MTSFGENLREQRKRKGLTQTQLAQLLGISQGSIWQYETGMKIPKIETVKRFADALGINATLLDGRLRVDFDTQNTYCVGEAIVEVPKDSIEDQALSLCKELSDESVYQWIALGKTLAGFQQNRRK